MSGSGDTSTKRCARSKDPDNRQVHCDMHRASSPLRALTLRQPWAWAVIHAGKDIENRSWSTSLRGTFAIHAGQGFDGLEDLEEIGVRPPRREDLVHGAIIGVVDLVDVVERHRSRWFNGPTGFVLARPRALTTPIPCTGALSFWRVSPEIERRIWSQLGR